MLEFIQSLNANSGATIAVLTALLTIITGFYATATWLALRKMDREFRFRIRPVLTATLRLIPHSLDEKEREYSDIELILESTNAPARLVSAAGVLVGGDSLDVNQCVSAKFNYTVAGRVIPKERKESFFEPVKGTYGWGFLRAACVFQDIYGVDTEVLFVEQSHHYIGQQLDLGKVRTIADREFLPMPKTPIGGFGLETSQRGLSRFRRRVASLLSFTSKSQRPS